MFPGGYHFGDITRTVLGVKRRAENDDYDDDNNKEELLMKLNAFKEQYHKEKQGTISSTSSEDRNHNNKKKKKNGSTTSSSGTSGTSGTSGISEQKVTASVSATALQGAIWPDPDPNPANSDSATNTTTTRGVVLVDDVTRLNSTEVKRVFQVRNTSDVQRVLEFARNQNFKVSMRGTQHCMGGHTIAPDGIVIDTCRMRDMHYDEAKTCVTVGPGVRWSDLIYYLNEFGQSPHTMQSYASFSIGGTIAVNAHGITTDLCSHESVLQFTVVKWDGSIVICKPESDNLAESELFKLCIGGYGMFGVITEIVLKCVPNSHLRMEMIPCKASSNFTRIYKGILEDPSKDIDLKLARLDTTNFEDINIFVFHRTSKLPTRSELPLHPKMMSVYSQMVYKWLAPSGGALRYAVERYTGRAVDWSDVNERNLLLYESAEPLARMYSPFYSMDDTFILQEYFVPFDQFQLWVKKASKIIRSNQEEEDNKYFTLLNTTIRYVQQDNCTLLAYSRISGGSFAFVLYFRMRRTQEADEELKKLHNDLVKATLECGGVFYLPYRHHYSQSQLEKAYPAISQFFEQKAKYDPHGLFDSLWFRQYGREYFDKVARKPLEPFQKMKTTITTNEVPKPITVSHIPKRLDSYRRVFYNQALCKEFFDSFLIQIFNVESSTTLQHAISRSIWDYQCTDDLLIYQNLCKELSNPGTLQALSKAWKQIKQLRAQKKELLRETSSILSRIGRLGTINDYVSIGDNGKMVLAFRDALEIRGTTYVVHDKEPKDIEIEAILERGSIDPVGTFVLYDSRRPTFIDIEDNSADLVTMNQGLHHIPEAHLIKFLQQVYRILRPGGIFIVREHDATPNLIPLLDVAHSVFNAVTGVPYCEECEEIRAFRPILEWRAIIESVGFTDTLMYEMEMGDPTRDEMMAFCKGDLSSVIARSDESQGEGEEEMERNACQSSLDHMMKQKSGAAQLPAVVDAFVDKVPNFLLELAQNVVDGVLYALDQMEVMVLKAGIPKLLHNAVKQTMDNNLEPIKQFLIKLRPYLDDAKLKEGQFELIPPELFLSIQVLFAKQERGDKMSLNESIAITAIQKVMDMFAPLAATTSDDTQSTEPTSDVSLSVDEVEQVFDRLFRAMPNFLEEESLKEGGLGFIVRVGRSYLNSSGQQIAAMIVPLLDATSWKLMKAPLEQIIQNPQDNRFTMDNICQRDSLWWQVAMGFLGSPHVKLGSYRLMAYYLGIGPLLTMWSEAQRTRSEEQGSSTSSLPYGALSNTGQKMLNCAVKLSHLENDVDILLDLLNETGIIEQGKSVNGAEFTWYKLVEWMQVEFVQIFGNFMEHTPWYRFPFMKMLHSYFEVLFKEFEVVSSTLGFNTAAFSSAFFIDLIPGVVMAALFAQMQLLALPLKKGLGDTYSTEDLSTQVEQIVVSVNPKTRIDWNEIDDRIEAKCIVPGLFVLTVPSLKPFSDVLLNIAGSNEDVRILRISNHEEVQMRVTVETKDDVDKLYGIRGCSIKFVYQLPTDGSSANSISPVSVSLGVKTLFLLDCIRECWNRGVTIGQIYDFWN